MNLDLSADQRELRELFDGFFAKQSPPDLVRAAEPLGFDAGLWERLRALGVPDLATETGLVELALGCEAAGRHLAPVPMVDALVVTRLLGEPAGLATFALRPAAGGRADLVPAGAVADTVVALDGDELVVLTRRPPMAAPRTLGGVPVADVDLRAGDRRVLATGAVATAAYEAALDDWRVLTAASLVGLAAGALTLAVDYVGTRHAFGVPVGSFQTVAHRLADLATAVDGARLLAWKAAWALDEGAPEAPALAASALVFAARTARDTAAASLHFHGGYGYMREYDVQLYLRRAAAWPLLLSDPAEQLRRVAALRRTAPPARPARRPAAAGTGGLDFRPDDAGAAVGDEIRAFLDAHLTDEIVERAHATGTLHDWGLHRAMAEAGWLGASWPVQRGGRGYGAAELGVLTEELAARGAPVDGWLTTDVVAHILDLVGSAEQRSTLIDAILAGEVLVCLGYTEPDCGSDVAAASTRAVRDGDEWVIDGQKMFTTLAHESAYVLLLTRTNPDVAKHRGLTMFLVPMDTPGVAVRAIETLGGERTNVTYYSDVRVPDSCRVGEVDGGWRVMAVALAFERELSAHADALRLLGQAERWAAAAGVAGGESVAERLARIAVDVEVGGLLGQRVRWLGRAGAPPVVEGSMAKLFCSEALQRAVADVLDVLGPVGVLAYGEPGAPADGWMEQAYRHAQVMTIRAGTSEIQRSIVAEQGLRLPRSRPV